MNVRRAVAAGDHLQRDHVLRPGAVQRAEVVGQATAARGLPAAGRRSGRSPARARRGRRRPARRRRGPRGSSRKPRAGAATPGCAPPACSACSRGSNSSRTSRSHSSPFRFCAPHCMRYSVLQVDAFHHLVHGDLVEHLPPPERRRGHLGRRDGGFSRAPGAVPSPSPARSRRTRAAAQHLVVVLAHEPSRRRRRPCSRSITDSPSKASLQ